MLLVLLQFVVKIEYSEKLIFSSYVKFRHASLSMVIPFSSNIEFASIHSFAVKKRVAVSKRVSCEC